MRTEGSLVLLAAFLFRQRTKQEHGCLIHGKACVGRQGGLLPVMTAPEGLAAGDGLVVSERGPGIFLQGLAVHGAGGDLLPGVLLSEAALLKMLAEGRSCIDAAVAG